MSHITQSKRLSRFKPGQVWQYRTRPGEEHSKLYIVKVDVIDDESVFHIYVDGLTLANPYVAGHLQSCLPHAAVNENSLADSVINLAEDAARMPDMTEGYEVWHAAFKQGKAGILDLPIASVVQLIEDLATGSGNC